MIEFYKDGDTLAIKTDANDEDKFIRDMSELLSGLIAKGEFMYHVEDDDILSADRDRIEKAARANDWEFQLSYLLPLVVDICCKMRGYKSPVMEQRVLVAGHIMPSSSQLVGVV